MKPTFPTLCFVALGLLSQAHSALVNEFQYNGHTYRIYNDSLTWTDANTTAQSLTLGGVNGNLLRINDLAEQNQVFSVLQTFDGSFAATAPDGGGARYLWIGGSDSILSNGGVEGNFQWSDNNDTFWVGGQAGAAAGGFYNNFGSGVLGSEPDNYNGNQNAVGLALDGWPTAFPGGIGDAGQWNDIQGSNQLGYVVEFAAIPEPATILMIASVGGLVMVWHLRRRAWRRQESLGSLS